MIKRQPTLQDVAAEACVSPQTVTRVLNNPTLVSERTRLKVLGAMNRLNYVPNRSAQALAGKLTPTLGMVSTSLAFHATSQIASFVKKYAAKRGYQVVITMFEEWNHLVLQAALNEFRAQRINRIVLCLPIERYDAEKLVADNPDMLCIFLDVPPTAKVSYVGFHYCDGTVRSVNHLLELGHRKFGLLTGPEISISARLRLACWRETLCQANIIDMDSEYGDWSARSGWIKAIHLFARNPDITAILVANDQMALGVMSALRKMKKRIPQDVSVIGYDDTLDSQYFYPALTTVAQNFDLLGKRVVHHMLAMEDQEKKSITELLPTTLVIRESTASPVETTYPSSLVEQLKILIEQYT